MKRVAAGLLGAVTAVLAALFVAMLALPKQVHILSGAAWQPRDGCTVAQAMQGAWQAVRMDRRLQALHEASAVVERDPAGYVRWRTPLGEYWSPEKDYSLFLVLAEMEEEPYGLPRAAPPPSGTVLDCGAHLGVFTRQALARGADRVVAIEPGPPQIYCLRQTFAREIIEGRVVVVPQGVWDSEGFLDLHGGSDSLTSSVAGLTGGAATRVPVTTIDRLITELQLSSVGFIKMDIEGAEPQALAGAARTLREQRPRLAIAAYHRPDDQRKIRAAVQRANPDYRASQIGCRVDLGVSVPLTLAFE